MAVFLKLSNVFNLDLVSCSVVEVINHVTFVFVACADNCDKCDDVSAEQCDEDGCETNYIFNTGGNAVDNYCVARMYPLLSYNSEWFPHFLENLEK